MTLHPAPTCPIVAPAALDSLTTWSLHNRRLERILAFEPAVGLYSQALRDLRTGADLLVTSAGVRRRLAEFEIRVDGRALSALSPDWLLIDAEGGFPDPAFNAARTLWLRHRDVPLEVWVGYRLTPHGTEKRLWIANIGPQPMRLSHVLIDCAPIELGPQSEVLVDAHYATRPSELYVTGRVEECAIHLRNARTGVGVFALSEVSGQLKRTEIGGFLWDGSVRIGYDVDLFPLEVRIPARSGWGTASAHLVLTQVGVAEYDPGWVLPATTATMQRKPGVVPLWHYNTWEPFGPAIDAATIRALIPIAARLGIEVFTIDDGWLDRYGANQVSAERFPDGLDPILSAVEAHGMRLGLWVSLAAIHPDLAAEAKVSAWRCREADGSLKHTQSATGEQAVMCLASPYKVQAAQRLIDLITRYHLAYVKLDLTTAFNAYGEAPGCHAPGHDHASAAESIALIYAAIAEITQAVYARHPDVLIDLTFELWGHKHVIDYGLLRAGDLCWLSNVGDWAEGAAGPRQARTLLYQRTPAIPAEAMLIGNLRADTGNPAEKFATALGACPLLLGDLRRLPEAVVDWYGDHVRWHRALRREVAFDAGFFKLGHWQQPSPVEWDGFARLSTAGEGLIVLFRNASAAQSARIQVPLPGEGAYALRSVLADRSLGARTAAEFRAGFDVMFGPDTVSVIEVRSVRRDLKGGVHSG
jgi:alpha-galactosidase